jgi:hypothetical protein
MNKTISLLAAASLVVSLAQGALAQDASSASDPERVAPVESKAAEPERTAAADDPITCKTQTETGSRVRKNKICMTQSEWEAHRKAARRYKEGIDRSRSTQPGGQSLQGH